MLKAEYPLAIADHLGIPPHAGVAGPWMSNQGTVLREWLLAVGEVLDVPYAGDKVTAMRALVEAVGMTWEPSTMASTDTPSGGGGNISLPAFEALLTGLQTQETAQRRRATNESAGPFVPSQPHAADDALVLGSIRRRRGQPYFRAALLAAYEGRCAISGCDAAAALEAAHIVPYGQGGTYDTSNGLLLRADLHTLFDLRLLSFGPGELYPVVLHPELSGTVYDDELAGLALRAPQHMSAAPSPPGLAAHRAGCDF